MEVAIEDSQSTTASCSPGYKRKTVPSEGKYDMRGVISASIHKRNELKRRKTLLESDCFGPFALPNLYKGEGESIYGSAAKGIAALQARRMEVLSPKIKMKPVDTFQDVEKNPSAEVAHMVDQKSNMLDDDDVIIMDDKRALNYGLVASAPPIIILDSDEEDTIDQRDCCVHQQIILEKSADEPHRDKLMAMDVKSEPQIDTWNASDETEIINDEGVYVRSCDENKPLIEKGSSLATEIQANKDERVNMTVSLEREENNLINATKVEKERDVNVTNDYIEGDEENDISTTTVEKDTAVNITDCDEEELDEDSNDVVCDAICPEDEKLRDRGVYVGVKEEKSYREADGLDDIWMELELSKEAILDQSSYESSEEDCDHTFILKDDIGEVCRVCGIIKRNIENILDFQYKVNRSSRTYMSTSQKNMDKEPIRVLLNKLDQTENESTSSELNAHPRHTKVMKPHQIEGFNFLVRNLMTQDPGGCILAHAPGSGKTFMMICFIQIFLTKYPRARVLVVLPKGILPTWKEEFETWKVEDVPLYDFYSAKADNRIQQLDVLNEWVGKKSILILGYKQFSSIVCDSGRSEAASDCKRALLEAPDIIILDEGHTSRNDNTALFASLAKINTPRRVILSGTLYQNHVKEVFNTLNLVRPRFLKLDGPSAIMRRIMCRIERKNLNGDAVSAFYDSVENTLQQDGNLKTKQCVIQDLREMTNKVLHYYKGDNLNDLPGLLDFTVLLNLTTKQKPEVQKIKELDYIKRASVGSLVYVHQQLKPFSDSLSGKSDSLLGKSSSLLGKSNSSAIDKKIDEMLLKIDLNEGAKARFFLNMLRFCESTGEKLLVFSQFLLPLKFLERLAVHVRGWSIGKELFMISGGTSSDDREWSMDQFNNSPNAKILFGSIKACGEGISLVGASRILILDVHVNPSVTRQALGRAFRPGQTRKVYTYRLVAADSPEEDDHFTCFKKEMISKMWFEYNDSMNQDFTIKTIEANGCGDQFLESSLFNNDIKVLYRR